MHNNLDRISERDRAVLRALVADKIEALLPLTRAGMPWRETFERAADHGARLESSPEERAWGIAHEFVLYESSIGLTRACARGERE